MNAHRIPIPMMSILVFLGVTIVGLLIGCQAISVPEYYSLDVEELDQLIIARKGELERLQRDREKELQDGGEADLVTEGRIRDLEEEIGKMVRLRRRLINLERSGRISGPV